MEVRHGGVQKSPSGGEGCPGNVWRDEAVIRLWQGIVGRGGFAGKDVETCAGEVTCVEGICESLFVHKLASASIDEEGGGLHLG